MNKSRWVSPDAKDPFCPEHYPFSCACWDVVTTHNHAELDLDGLDHLSALAMRTTCDHWLLKMWDSGAIPDGTRAPVHLAGDLWTAPVTFEWDETENFSPPWPIPSRDSTQELLLVLQSRVEEPASERLARILRDLPQWEQVCAAVAAFEFAHHPKDLLAIIAEHGLPCTLTTAHWVASQVGKELDWWLESDQKPAQPPIGPSRGVVVVSFGLRSKCGPVGSMAHRIETNWRTDALMREALTAASKHERFWNRVSPAQYSSDLRMFNSRPPDPFTPLCRRFLNKEVGYEAFYQSARRLNMEILGLQCLTIREEESFKRELQSKLKRQRSQLRSGANWSST